MSKEKKYIWTNQSLLIQGIIHQYTIICGVKAYSWTSCATHGDGVETFVEKTAEKKSVFQRLGGRVYLLVAWGCTFHG